ncbi:MAG: hypothetical protein R6W86_15175 [Marinobacter sp.]|uniref:hypothetical protein n=1 Tax=Marinobacter sp. TaxID=50741 RepID=UPI00396E31F5
MTYRTIGTRRIRRRFRFLPAVTIVFLLAGCFGDGGSSDSAPTSGSAGDSNSVAGNQVERFSDGRTFLVNPGAEATHEMVSAMIQLRPGDTLEFGCGFFELKHGLLMKTASQSTPTSTRTRPAITTPTSSTTRASANCPSGAPASMTTTCLPTARLT